MKQTMITTIQNYNKRQYSTPSASMIQIDDRVMDNTIKGSGYIEEDCAKESWNTDFSSDNE